MSEFIEKLKSRRSVRSFKSEMPPKEVIDEIIPQVCMHRQE